MLRCARTCIFLDIYPIIQSNLMQQIHPYTLLPYWIPVPVLAQHQTILTILMQYWLLKILFKERDKSSILVQRSHINNLGWYNPRSHDDLFLRILYYFEIIFAWPQYDKTSLICRIPAFTKSAWQDLHQGIARTDFWSLPPGILMIWDITSYV